MKKLSFVFILLTFLSCNNSPYLLNDNNPDKTFLIEHIKNLKRAGLINSRPSLVLNGELITYESLKKCKLNLYKEDIDSIYAVFKKDDLGAKYLYGNDVKNGVILIKIKKRQKEWLTKT
jgi:hypothetical protein